MSNGLKLEMAVQNLRGLYRRHIQGSRAIVEIDERQERITIELKTLNERLTFLAQERIRTSENLQAVQEYMVEVENVVVNMFWTEYNSKSGNDSNQLSLEQKDRILKDFFAKNRLGASK